MAQSTHWSQSLSTTAGSSSPSSAASTTRSPTTGVRAIGIDERRLGPENPRVMDTVVNTAIAYAESGRLDEARPVFERILAFHTKLDPTGPDMVNALVNVAEVCSESGKPAEGLEHGRRAVELSPAVGNPAQEAVARVTYGKALGLVGRHQEALAAQTSRALSKKVYGGESHPNLAYAFLGLGESWLGLHQTERAQPLLERAVVLSAGDGGVPRQTAADARFALARALVEGRRDVERAHVLAREAAGLYRTVGGAYVRRAERVDAWLAEQPHR